MGLSKLEICQHALLRVSEDEIVSLDEESKAARLCNRLYQQSFNEVMREFKWNGARGRISLVQTSNTPLFGYSFSFALPLDCERVIRVFNYNGTYNPYENYSVEGNELLTDIDSIFITYVKRVDDPRLLDSLATSAVICKLAGSLAMPLTSNSKLETSLITEYETVILPKAKRMNSFENNEFDYDDFSDTWIEARYTTGV